MAGRRAGIAIAAIVVVAAVAAGWWYVAGRTPALDRADAGDPALVALGRTVYDDQCASCHGAELEGQPDWRSALPEGGRPAPPHDDTGHTFHHADKLLFDIVKEGGQAYSPPGYKNNMPAFTDALGDREVWASLAYIKSRWPDPIRARQERINEISRRQ